MIVSNGEVPVQARSQKDVLPRDGIMTYPQRTESTREREVFG